jgi:hypothetical protein
MKNRVILVWALIFPALVLGAEPLYSPSWGFRLDLPEEYELTGGDHKNQFSFESPFGSYLDLAVYTDKQSAPALAAELETKLSNRGERHVFTFNGKQAVLMELRFANPSLRNTSFTGWALCIELEQEPNSLLAAMAYGPDKAELQNLHLSVLDSIEGGEGDRRLPGPVTGYFHPRGAWIKGKLAGINQEVFFRENDARAAQSVVDREFGVMKFYTGSGRWQEAWKRFYRAIFKDSFDRLENAAFILERNWNNSVLGPSGEGIKAEEADRLGRRPGEAANIAAKALEWIQNFIYERDLMGSDFVNLVSAAQEGRGDCDSRAMLWAIILEQADIPAGIMVSREFSHAMGLADIEGEGARFPMKSGNVKETRWLVAEPIAKVSLGLIAESFSELSAWMGILFE